MTSTDGTEPAPIAAGLVICGEPPAALTQFSAGYLPMFQDLLGPFGVELTALDARRAQLSPEPDRFAGYVITGSATSVYDDEPWIAGAEDFIRQAVAADMAVVGVCFGHQLVAQALGGQVQKANVGWGVGIHEYDLVEPLPIDGVGATGTMRLQAMHQDQVVEAPEGAQVWATSAHCPIAGFSRGERLWTVQAHPEFTAELSDGIIGLRAERLGPDLVASARADINGPTDHIAVAERMAEVLRS